MTINKWEKFINNIIEDNRCHKFAYFLNWKDFIDFRKYCIENIADRTEDDRRFQDNQLCIDKKIYVIGKKNDD